MKRAHVRTEGKAEGDLLSKTRGMVERRGVGGVEAGYGMGRLRGIGWELAGSMAGDVGGSKKDGAEGGRDWGDWGLQGGVAEREGI